MRDVRISFSDLSWQSFTVAQSRRVQSFVLSPPVVAAWARVTVASFYGNVSVPSDGFTSGGYGFAELRFFGRSECRKSSGMDRRMTCDLTARNGTCVECLRDRDCENQDIGKMCLKGVKKCVECKKDEHCDMYPTKKFCKLSTGTCVTCLPGRLEGDEGAFTKYVLNPEACPEGSQCNEATNKCVECAEDSYCTRALFPICDGGYCKSGTTGPLSELLRTAERR